MSELPSEGPLSEIEQFHFRHVHPNVRFGTASDRYAGWIGQIYPHEYASQVASRRRTLDGKKYDERTVPITSAADFFDHFGALEVDYTYYRPLRDDKGEPTTNYFVLGQYAEHAPDDAVFFLKVPQSFFARTLRRGGKKVEYLDNPDFLNARAYLTQFHDPAVEILGERLGGMVFEQEYQRKSESPDPEQNVAELDAFFREVPPDVQPHIELRSEHLLVPAYFDWLEDRGIGYVFSHWTWLPPLRKQWRMSGERFTASDGNAIVRLLTPLNVKYADAYAMAYPFDKPVSGLCDTPQAEYMVKDVVSLVQEAEKATALLNVIVNNRAWGNAPVLAQELARRLLA
ncbi:MAG: DUF72 domain-containing protein [Rhodothermales bacterium]